MLTGLTWQRETDGMKMKLYKGVILLFLGLFIKVSVAGNSTQVFYIELEFESLVDVNVTKFLGQLKEIDLANATVTQFNSTTKCNLSEINKQCQCMPGYTWSDDVECTDQCTLNINRTAVCLTINKVSIDGTTTITNRDCTILCDQSLIESSKHKEELQNLTTMLATKYSQLDYFDSLVITGYGSGSLILNYTVIYLGPVSMIKLQNVVQQVENTNLVTKGFINIDIAEHQPVDINSSATITCTPSGDMGPTVNWFLTNGQNKTTEITNGQEATLKTNGSKSIAQLKYFSESWKGTFKCVYAMNAISHTASEQLDVALLPNIQALSDPQFPDCRGVSSTNLKVYCNISADSENYTVTWISSAYRTTVGPTDRIGNRISYTAYFNIKCIDETLKVSCTFKNNRSRNNLTRTQNMQIPIILENSITCPPEGVWPIAKSSYTATLTCDNSGVGRRMRNCTGGVWSKEISTCVNANLFEIQTDVQELNKGIGFIKDNADQLFQRINDSTTLKMFTFPNIETSVKIFGVMDDVSIRQQNQWNDTVMSKLVSSASNLLNDPSGWKNPKTEDTFISVQYLKTIERMMNNSNLISNVPYISLNAQMVLCNHTSAADLCKTFNASVSNSDNSVVVFGFRNLYQILPTAQGNYSNTTILSVTPVNATNMNRSITLEFDFAKQRLPNHMIYCVYWDENLNNWSSEGCTWAGADNPTSCTCTHNSAFTILMSKNAETLPYMDELTYAGLGISILSLLVCLIIKILVWDAVVKSPISNFRHVALFNISLCLLFAHCTFLTTAKPENIPPNWCAILTLIKHFFFLAVFFWMLCLSFVLLHQMIYVFDRLRKKVFLGLSITVGYVCPIIAVAVTYITFNNGAEGEYYSKSTCWLTYKGTLKGSLFAFIFPIGAIVFVNLFTLAVVIMKIATPSISEAKARDEKDVAKSMIKTIVFLSPVLGLSWILGFFVLGLDLTVKPWAALVNYSFTIFNSLQGLFILLTNCVGEKKIRDALLKRFKIKQSVHSKTESSTKAQSSIMRK
ncbi:adhesion G-protein coupled receptor F3 isoform X2 [Danio aesculapii]|uniref:adhesion G-protein coupled receptor F3 isoform X2 n=1 Tax=Danio aesculapii TaxID=1142201 RepID=UPI0024BF55CE|nr:adhesion G-protein coupled receptor F3 isoform X2 [Danio aesculapii]